MEAIIEAVNEDFKIWLHQRNKTLINETIGQYSENEYTANMKEFLFDVFSISPSMNISLENIALAYSSEDPEK